MRIVIDTNFLISAFIRNGVCRRLLEHFAQSNHKIVVSEFILDEFTRTLQRKFGYELGEVETAAETLMPELVIVEPVTFPEQICRDPDDDAILGTAVAGNADCIVTGDSDLLVLDRFRDVDIISPSEFAGYEVERQ